MSGPLSCLTLQAKLLLAIPMQLSRTQRTKKPAPTGMGTGRRPHRKRPRDMSNTNHTTLADIAQIAQDAIGWANPNNPDDMGTVLLELARVVTKQAREIDSLRERLADTETRVNELEAAADATRRAETGEL